jgi:hypothetical protein
MLKRHGLWQVLSNQAVGVLSPFFIHSNFSHLQLEFKLHDYLVKELQTPKIAFT